MLSDLGGAASLGLVQIGDALGLYKTLHVRGPMTVGELAGGDRDHRDDRWRLRDYQHWTLIKLGTS